MTRIKRKTHKNGTKFTGQIFLKSGQFAYIGRRDKKANFKTVWVTRINTAIKNLSYSSFISKLKMNNILLNKKMLAQLTTLDSPAFSLLSNVEK